MMKPYRELGIVTVVLLFFVWIIPGCQPAPAPTSPVTRPPHIPEQNTPPAITGSGMIEPATSFSVTQIITNTVHINPNPRTNDCPHLDSTLRTLATIDTPESFAQAHNLFFDEGQTRIVIELGTPKPDTSFLNKYHLHIETETDSLIQALAPLDTLCALSNNPEITFVSIPRNVIAP
jgi:hypothetical protein